MSKKISNILEAFVKNQLIVGEITKEKQIIDEMPNLWMDIKDPNKVKIFIDAVEKDQNFAEVSMIAGTIHKEIILVGDKKIVDLIQAATKKIDMFSRYVAMAYTGLKVGLKAKDGGEDIIGCYRIGDWNLPGYYSVIMAFSLEGMVETWDEETSLCKPVCFKNGKLVKTMIRDSRYWDFGQEAWNELIEYYLVNERKIEIVSNTEAKNLLLSLLKKDELLLTVNPKILPMLNEVLCVDNLYLLDQETLEKIVQILKNYSIKSSFIEDGVIGVIQSFSGPHKMRGWDVRISSSVVHVFAFGKMYVYEFDPFFEYEDYEGGRTYHSDNLNAQKIESISSDISVVVLMKDGRKVTIKPIEASSFERKREKGEKEKYYDDTFRIWTRLTYNGDPKDLDFGFQDKKETY